MKIGILTHQYVNNFGAFLQAYALQEALAQLFPDDDVRIIDYVNSRHALINTAGWFRYYRGRENLRGWLQKARLPLTFGAARRASFRLTRRCHTAKQVNALGLDCIVVGSDEVWNYRDRKAADAIKFGAGLDCENLIAYAPSVGNTSAADGIPAQVAEGMRRFRAISARDDATAELVKAVTGREPVRVLDPTFLVPSPARSLDGLREPYILFYYCDGLPDEARRRILERAEADGMAVYGAGECDRRYSRITVNLHPFQWAEMFRRASFVYTGTFHGAVFSILNRRPFRVYLTNASRVKKVRALLGELGIDGRELSPDDPAFADARGDGIDYARVEAILAERRSQSMAYLRDSILAVKQRKGQ